MPGFAELELADNLSQIPVKFNILRKAPIFMLDWYIRKFNPFTVKDAQPIFGERGLSIRLPVTVGDMQNRPEFYNDQVSRTLYALRDYGVEIVLPPAMPMYQTPRFPDILPSADGRGVFPFFMIQAIEKTLSLVEKDIKTAEILLIDGDYNLTMCVLDNIYTHVNYLTLISDFDYSEECADIYSDCGLNIGLSEYNRSSLTSADIIINTRSGHKFDYYYKRGAIYFELAAESGAELSYKRPDILLVDGLRLRNRTDELTLPRFECGLHTMSRDYRRIKRRYDSRAARAVAERIKSLGYTVRGLGRVPTIRNV